MITWINPTSQLAQSHHRARSLYFIVKGDIFLLYARLKRFCQRWCVYLLECTQLGPEVARDGSDLERQEGQRPVLSEGDGELHTSCIHPERKWEVKGKQGQICKYLIHMLNTNRKKLFSLKQYAFSYFVTFDLDCSFTNSSELTEPHFCDPVSRVTTKNPLLTDPNVEKHSDSTDLH